VIGRSIIRDAREHNKHKTNNIMKKFILIAAAAIVASVGISYAANSMLKVEDHSKCGTGSHRCNACNGTGWQPNGQNKCMTCRGTGTDNSY